MGWRQTLVRMLEDYSPFGVLAPNKPRHFREVAGTVFENWGQWHRAWSVLNGPCNGCAVQTDGLRDNVLPHSPHFCLVRLGLIEEVLRRDADPMAFADAAAVARLGNDRIERLGRIVRPLLWRRRERGYQPISFEEAYELAGQWIGQHRGNACGFFATSKGVNNEEYYAFQQFARVIGQTNNVDSCARQCHAASVTALKSTLGVGASTGSLSDFINTDVLVLAGTNLANNQPLVMRYIEQGRRSRGGKPFVIVVNAYREPGLHQYWVPSSVRSAVLGTRICDEFVHVQTGGDIAFFNGVLKVLIQDRLLTDGHLRFIRDRTTGFEDLEAVLAGQSLESLAVASGVPIVQMRRVAMVLARCENAMFVWGMGLTQHARGTDNVKSIVNVALALGQIGRPKAGVAALRGQSGVQGSGECGVAPNIFPGGVAVEPTSAEWFSQLWGACVSPSPGLATGRMIEAADRGDIQLLVSLGGNLRETMPDRRYVHRVLAKVPFRIRFDVMMNAETTVAPGEASLVIPIRNWYEWDSVYTTTSTDRTIRAFTGTLKGVHRDLPESWQAMKNIAARVVGAECDGFGYADTQQIRDAMDASIGMYRGISKLSRAHEQMQWGGPFLCGDGFPSMPGGRAKFAVLEPDRVDVPPGWSLLSTRRGFGQWNSQHRISVNKDSFTGATTRRTLLMHPNDAAASGVSSGEAVRVISRTGVAVTATCRVDANVRQGHVQAFWPLANELIPAGIYDEASTEPDYNVVVRVERDG